MKSVAGYYWAEALIPTLSQDAITLNDPSLDSLSCLNLLCLGSMGTILVVTQLFDETGPITQPLIMI
jgi:hypothetical protein